MATKMTREEAIKKVRQMSLPKETMEILEALAPELAESEDERIWEALYDFISGTLEDYLSDYGISKGEALAYLEKQKEHKQEKFPPYVTGFKGDPDPAGTSDLEEAAKEYASKTLCDPDDGPSTGLAKESFIAGAEWQKEQKPASISRGHEIVKPAEWNDTDMKEARDNLISVCRDWERGMQTALLPIVAVRARYFLEHLTEPKPVEWSEEDEDRIRQIERIAQQAGCTQKLQEEIHDWLRSLRPSWKPSEEQMNALYDACCIAFEEERDFHPSLSRLYHDLRKLIRR